MTSSFSRRVRKAGEEMELHSILLCRKCGATGVSVQVHHLPAAVLLCQCFCSLSFLWRGTERDSRDGTERAVLSAMEVCNYFLPHDGGVFLKVASPL